MWRCLFFGLRDKETWKISQADSKTRGKYLPRVSRKSPVRPYISFSIAAWQSLQQLSCRDFSVPESRICFKIFRTTAYIRNAPFVPRPTYFSTVDTREWCTEVWQLQSQRTQKRFSGPNVLCRLGASGNTFVWDKSSDVSCFLQMQTVKRIRTWRETVTLLNKVTVSNFEHMQRGGLGPPRGPCDALNMSKRLRENGWDGGVEKKNS